VSGANANWQEQSGLYRTADGGATWKLLARKGAEQFGAHLSPHDQGWIYMTLREGPAFGVHVVAWADALATLERTLSRQALAEFDHRVLFQMSAADSSHLIDSPESEENDIATGHITIGIDP
jgi:hypothetical protein